MCDIWVRYQEKNKKKKKNFRPTDPSNFGPVTGNPSFIFFGPIISTNGKALTTEVGVAVFSVTLKNNVRTLKLQISSPDPEIDVQIPPRNPVIKRTTTFHSCKNKTIKCQVTVFMRKMQVDVGNGSLELSTLAVLETTGVPVTEGPSMLMSKGLRPKFNV